MIIIIIIIYYRSSHIFSTLDRLDLSEDISNSTVIDRVD